MKKYEKGEIVEIVLRTLLLVGFISFAIAAPNAVQIFKYFDPKNARERARIKNSVTRLEKAGFIKRKDGKGGVFMLTESGREKAMRYAIAQMQIISQKKWDKKWRLVMFDVPEEKRQARRGINFALKKLGCIQYQKSVFVTPFPCEKEIDFVGECFNVREYIRIVVASEIERSEQLNKVFKVS
ncbi:MAG: CRISPR-associated endonuclease Cas2 [bacterium]|nr:CRISPR-associated endonuclease Cas2 [bacterium]